ncbi:HAD-IA family hydrolase [Pseudonocardia endophytica]|uniref:Sugar-phosphatase n=1 Tax=Pseudonocardia endophytica TaxID=401976 RepID=A0A4R1I482_PSEEN|nr:HAD-IA family hydrolase [Pseudonocardia endophytica]TCK24832.1 sugar-phosphatase [Pseudonocardia endophytica]
MDGIRAVLFDMDGTLVESDAAVARAWSAWADEYGVAPEALSAVAHGVPADGTIRILRPDLDEAGVAAASVRQMELQYTDLDEVVALPGAHELVAALDAAAVPWAIVTSADRELARRRLGVAGIEAPVLVARDDVARGKPDPEGYRTAAAALGVAAQECLVVEDADAGLAAGRAAGARTAALRGLDGDLRLRGLSDLLPLFDATAARPTA